MSEMFETKLSRAVIACAVGIAIIEIVIFLVGGIAEMVIITTAIVYLIVMLVGFGLVILWIAGGKP